MAAILIHPCAMTRLIALLCVLMFALPGLASAQSPSPARERPFVSERIVVEARGRGPDVILIPGLASTGDVWARTAARRAQRSSTRRRASPLRATAPPSGLLTRATAPSAASV
jgi:hypothetical protein